MDVWKAAELGLLGAVKKLVSEGTPIDKTKRGDVTALHMAALGGHVEMVEWLLDNGANINARTLSQPGYPGAETPLYLAVAAGRTSVVDLLVRRGAKLNLKSSDGTSALAEASGAGHTAIVSLLVDNGADLNPRGDFSPLFLAINARQLDIAKYLISRGARIDAKTPPYKGSLLMSAAGSKWIDGLELLLQLGADVNYQDETGMTALHWGVLGFASRSTTWDLTNKRKKAVIVEPESAIPIVKRLLDAGAQSDIRNRDGFTAREYAKKIRAQLLIDLFEKPV